ncbi:MAG: aminotransferase class V-fold PLP-dependent enzyme, partial [bacterium]|nr:aminotransferase class V-fold PLP-dependent enzyme [bacterium]
MAKTSKKIYMDYASSVEPNAGSIHAMGVKSKNRLEEARTNASLILNAHKNEIIFTNGGTESNNIAIQGVVWNTTFFPHIITTNIEHPSILETFKLLEKRKLAEITII